MTVQGYREFEFDLPDALLRNLVAILDEIEKTPLSEASVANIPDEQGVYQLFLDDQPVYVGKTDADAGLLKRLSRHSKKIQQRKNLSSGRVSFKAVRIFVFTAVDLETDLIKHYGGVRGLAWNGSGFGSNDPGRERDTTNNKPDNFDYQYPIDIDCPLDVGLPDSATAAEILNQLRNVVPYTIRAQRKSGRKYHDDLEDTTVTGFSKLVTARNIVSHMTAQLPQGWQATKLLGYIIIYKESGKNYPQSEMLAAT
ncbi:hypothetical protein ABIC08_009100 [Bradyrhizobium sp. RT9b]|uniref:GIY-YIG nuclease family protein n=1 Tax=Bradyrhizobium sp. RT9b TaxID=3156385 RepID=UPI003396CC25